MAVSNVELRVDARNAIGALRQVNTASKNASTSTDQLKNAVRRSGSAMDGMSRQARNASTAVSGLGGAIAKLAVAAAALQTVRFVFTSAAELETQTRSIQTLTGSVEKARQIISELQAIGAVTPFTSTELIEAAKRLTAFGVSADQVVETTRRLGDVAGATGANLGELTLAYGQVIAKGRLQGEELLQFQERGVALQDELRKMYNLTGEEFSKALSKGQISAEAVEVAVRRLTEAGGKYANGAIAQSDTLNGKLSTLQDSFQRLAQNIGKFFEPVFKFLIDGINGFLERVNSASRLQAEVRANEAAGLAARQRFGLRSANPFDQDVAAYKEQVRRSAMATFMRGSGRASTSAPNVPPLGGGSGGAAVGGGGRGAASKAAREAERAAEALKRSVERGDELYRQYSRQAALLGDMNEIDRKRLQISYDHQDRATEIAELKNAEQRVNLTALNDEIKRLQLLELQTEERKKQLDLFYQLAGFSGTPGLLGDGAGAFMLGITLDPGNEAQNKINELKTQLETLQNPINLAQSGAQGIADAFSSTFSGIISGAQSAQEALATFFQNVANSFLNMATEIIAKMIQMYVLKSLLGIFGGGGGGIFGAAGAPNYSGVFGAGSAGLPGFTPGLNLLPQRAMGGSVSGGQPYLVGERGPELFMPGRSGGIAPTGSFGGGVNVVVNVDASGTSVQGDQSQGAALGRVVAAAVQAELIKQKRPGGLLTT
jgi:tape measure domain-containing protein